MKALAFVLLLGACAPLVSQPAVCKGTAADRDALTAALLADGGPESLMAGQVLIARLDAFCDGA